MTGTWKRRNNRTACMSIAALVFAAMTGLHGGAARGGTIPLSLERAIELGLENDEALHEASLAVEGARGQVTQARSNALPQLSLSGQYSRNFLLPSFFLPEAFREGPDSPAKVSIGEDNEFVGQAAVTQVLWAAGRVSAGLEAAKAFLESYRYREIASADYVRFSVKEAYFGALLAAEALAIAEKAMQETEEALRVARLGFDQGTVSRFDVMRAEVELANRRTPLVKARNDLDQALIVLKRRCGLDAGAEVALTDTLGSASHPADLETLIASMREGSAEIRALENYLTARRQYLRIAKAERYPMLQLSAYYGVQTQWSSGFFPPSDLVATSSALSIGIQIPIFDGLNAKGKINTAAADMRVAELELERVLADKEVAVRQSWLSLENALTALEGSRETVQLAEEAHRLALVRLANGLATPLERLDAELAMTTARGQLAETRYACQIARAYLELTVGSDTFRRIEAAGE